MKIDNAIKFIEGSCIGVVIMPYVGKILNYTFKDFKFMSKRNYKITATTRITQIFLIFSGYVAISGISYCYAMKDSITKRMLKNIIE